MERYWFRPKRYGYGATPVTWEGWAVTLAFVAAIMLLSVLVSGRTEPVLWIAWAGAVVFAVAVLWVVSKRKTKGAWRWRWGED